MILVKNFLYNLLGQGLPLVVGLFCIPLLVEQLGVSRFGFLTLLWAFLGYLTFLDLGLSRAIIKLISEHLVANERQKIAQVFWTTAWLLLVLSLLGIIVIIISTPFVVKYFFVAQELPQQEINNSLYLICLGIPILTFTAAFRGVLEAQQRFFVVNILNGFTSAFTYIAPLLISYFTVDISCAFAALLVARLLSLIGHGLVTIKKFPEMKTFYFPNRVDLSRLAKFGGWVTITNLVGPMMVYFDRFFLSGFIPLSQIAFYTTPYEIVSRLLIIPGALSRVLFPSAAALYVESESKVRRLTVNAVQLMMVFLLPPLLILFLFAKPGLLLWLGAEFSEQSYLILQIFVVGVFFNGLATVPYTIIQSVGRPDLTAKLHLIELPLYVGVFWLLTDKYGIQGAAIAWTARAFLDLVLMVSVLKKLVKKSIS